MTGTQVARSWYRNGMTTLKVSEVTVRNQRAIIIGVAAAIAAVAAFAAWRLLSTADERAQREAVLVDVFVATKDIPEDFPGERALDEQYIKKDQLPQRNYPAGAVQDIQSIRGKLAAGTIRTGLPIVDTSFIDVREASSSLSQKIGAGLQAVTVQVDRIKGVGGFVQPGDHVNIIVTSVAVEGGRPQTRFLLQGVRVLLIGAAIEEQVGPTPPPQGTVTAPSEPGVITFEVSAADAVKIAHVAQTNTSGIYLTLVPEGYQATSVSPVDDTNLF